MTDLPIQAEGASNIGPTAGLETGASSDPNGSPVLSRSHEWALKEIASSRGLINKWRKQAKECDSYEAGHFFTKAQRAQMRSMGRPDAAFNTAQKFMRGISGIEMLNRRTVRFLPRVIEDTLHAIDGDLRTKLFEWVISNCQGDSERSRAFADMTRRGMGWTSTYLEQRDDPNGMICVGRVDGLEMLWDSRSRTTNLDDAQWVARERKLPKGIAKRRWPEHKEAIEVWAGEESKNWSDLIADEQPNELKNLRNMQSPFETSGDTITASEVTVTEFQWWEEIPGHYFIDPLDGKPKWLEEDQFDNYVRRYKTLYAASIISSDFPEEIDSVPQMSRRWRRMLFMGRILLEGPDDLPGRRFTYNCMTGAWDGEDDIWYGLFRLLIDPQRYLTKFINLIMEIIGRQRKGSVFAESDAFVNMYDAEQRWGQPGAMIWMQPNKIDRVKEAQTPQIPSGLLEMFRICLEMNTEATGISPAAMMGIVGKAGSSQPALTFRHQQMANIALLALEFSALDRYRISEALTVQDYLPFIQDGRLIRVGGTFDSQVVQLIHDPDDIKYDLVLDEQAERDPNVREMYTQFILQMAPTLLRTDQFIPELLDFLPLPVRVRERIKDAMTKQSQAKMQMEAQGLGASKRGGSPLEIRARADKLAADAMKSKASAAKLLQSIEVDKAKVTLEALSEAWQAMQAKAQPSMVGQPPPDANQGFNR